MKKRKYHCVSYVLILPFDANRILAACPRRVKLTARQARRNVYLKPSAPIHYLQFVTFNPEGKVVPEVSTNIKVPSEAWSVRQRFLSPLRKPLKPELRIYLGRDVSQYRHGLSAS